MGARKILLEALKNTGEAGEMCLALPARVVELRGKKAVVEQLGQEKEVFNNMVNAKKGEFVLVQQGFAVQKISEKEARETLKAWEGKI